MGREAFNEIKLNDSLCFFCVVSPENEDSWGYHTEQTKGKTVTIDVLLKKERTIGLGTAAIPTENTLHQTAVVEAAARFLGVVSFEPRQQHLMRRNNSPKRTTTTASTLFPLFGQKSLAPIRNSPSAARIHTESENPIDPQ